MRLSDPTETRNAKEDSVQVAIRMRPLNSKEHSSRRAWQTVTEENCIFELTAGNEENIPQSGHSSACYTFDKTFGEDASTEDVYVGIGRGIVNSIVTGHNGTIFAYGQTSSGKTYTMQGWRNARDSACGIVQMAARDIFAHIENEPSREFLIRTSFIEIYNEEVRDLLPLDGGKKGSARRGLTIHESKKRGVFVNCSETIVTDAESLVETLFSGEKNRVVASTKMNARSSRSHTIFRITVESRENNTQRGNEDSDNNAAVLISTLNLVDLAGSESVRHTGATGQRQKEGSQINRSLLTLSRVIEGLSRSKRGFINFRDSKLTRILQPSLSGNARIAVICCATPSELYMEETRSTLKFASRAKLVKTKAQKNEVIDDRSLIKQLQRELAEARRALAEQEKRLQLHEGESKSEVVGTPAEVKCSRLRSMILRGGTPGTIAEKDSATPLCLSYPRSATLTPAALHAALSESSEVSETSMTSETSLLEESDDEERALGNGGRGGPFHHSIAVLHYAHRDEMMSMFGDDDTGSEYVDYNLPLFAEREDTSDEFVVKKATAEVDILKEALASQISLARDLQSKLDAAERRAVSLTAELSDAKAAIDDLSREREEAVAILRNLDTKGPIKNCVWNESEVRTDLYEEHSSLHGEISQLDAPYRELVSQIRHDEKNTMPSELSRRHLLPKSNEYRMSSSPDPENEKVTMDRSASVLIFLSGMFISAVMMRFTEYLRQ